MTTLKGRPMSPGYAEGVAWFWVPTTAHDWSRADIAPEEVSAELRRFRESLTATSGELQLLRDRASVEIGDDQAGIFGVQLAILADAQFVTEVEDRIERNRRSAEHALISFVENWLEGSGAVTDEHRREQAVDMRDLAQRLMSHLSGRPGSHPVLLPEQSVIVTGELSPSDVMQLDRSRIVAAVTEWGGPTGHAAILLRSLGIPAVTGVTGVRDRIHHGQSVLVNGELGTVIGEANDEETAMFRNQQARHQQFVESLSENEAEPCTTLDGVRVSLFANISRAGEVADAVAHHLEGVDLLRTELLFASDEPPSLLDQYEAYRGAAEALAGRPLVVRTFDLGGDKIPRFLEPWAQANPNLSLRGLGFALRQEHLFRTQMLAILDAAQHYDIGVLFPMVMGSDDLRAAIDLVRDVASAHGLPVPLLGAMIETPSALFALDEITPQVGFLSLGTNDLAQLMLGADRDAAELSEEYAAVYPTILRAIRRVIEAAENARLPLTVCGEMAGHPIIAPLLVGLGIRRLSMAPSRCVEVRYALQNLDCREAEATATQALQCHSRQQVRQLLTAWNTLGRSP
ncbi:MAG: phosphoenolpyruvate--protein phosphotransferase [Planctomycetes bacterium]|jgi:phosphoenolpyruvate-protein phosphotransferase|nr:phosphoenolpyruvate--protein phosphotransferase [Planctomycetota bacterium]